MKRKLLRIIAAVLSVVVVMGSFTGLISFAEELYPEIVAYPRGDDPDYKGTQNRDTWGYDQLYYNNGWGGSKGTDFTNLYCLDYKRIAYCIEPGTNIETPGTLSSNNGVDWNKMASQNDALNAKQIEDALSQVLYHGFQPDGTYMYSWHVNNGGGEKIAKAYATQLLVWEIVVGERDAEFNHIEITDADEVLEMVKPGHPLRSSIMYHYNEIVRKVQSNIKTPKGFATERTEAEDSPYELEYANGKFIYEVEDPALEGYTVTILPRKDGRDTNISCVLKNGKLTVTSTRPFSDVETIMIQKSYTTGNILIYSDGIYENANGKQDLVYYAGQKITPHTKTFYLSFECPHHHVFIPYTYRPTCSEQGYTVWKCACGIWSSEDPVTGEDSHVPATGHDFENSVWVTSIKATCNQAGESVQLCGKCGAVIDKKEIPATGHDSGVWVVDIEATNEHDGTMLLYCTKCGDVIDTKTFEYHDHVKGHTELIRSASCKENGLEGVCCSECNACYEYNEVQSTGHCAEEETIWVVSSQAGCTTKGEYKGHCSVCGLVIRTKEMPALGHGNSYRATTVFPTCENKGEESEICVICGETLATEVLPATGHDEGVWTVTVESGCTTEGEESRVCTSCDNVIETKAISAEGHDDGVWRVDFDATPEHDGQMSRYCSKCGAVLETKPFARHTHTEGYRLITIEPTCTSDGQEGVFCSICGAEYDSKVIPAFGHDYSEIYMNVNGTHSRSCSTCKYVETSSCSYAESTVEANCTDYGYSEYTCTVCGYTYRDEFENALGHDMSNFVDDENGMTHTSTCSRCGLQEMSTHFWSEWRLIAKDGLEETYQRKCEACGALQTAVVKACEEPHGHTMEHFDAVPPTCTEDGRSEYYHCTDPECDKYYSDHNGETEIEKDSWIIPAHGHNYVLKDEKPASCTEDGYRYYECTHDASHNYKETEPMHGHNYILKETVEPTCTENGYKYYECTHDASHNYKEVLEAHGHDYRVIPEKCKEATPDEPGYTYYECSHDPAHNYIKTVYYVGNMDTSKTADYDDSTGVATINLNSSTGAQEIEVSSGNPIDIVLVLDTSGSMGDGVVSEKKPPFKINVLKDTAKAFVESVSNNAKQYGIDHRLSIVTFASEAYLYKSNGSKFQYGKTLMNASDSFISVNGNEAKINSIINGLVADGATRAEYGFKTAELVINENCKDKKAVVIFITDGYPTRSNTFSSSVANDAVSSSLNMKNRNVSVYSIGFNTDDKDKNMLSFMNAVSSNYPNATSIYKLNEKAEGEYYRYAGTETDLSDIFEDVFKTEIAPSKPFKDITLVDTISKEFTMTSAQEEKFRNDVISEYGITNNDITVEVNEDGTTSVEIRHLDPKLEYDENGNPVKYYVSVSFDVTANQYAQGKSYYYTNTDYAGVIIDGIMIDKFDSPSVSVNDDRNLVVFTAGDDIYAISQANIGDPVKAPECDYISWNIPEGFKVSEKYTEFEGTYTSEVKEITWNYSGGFETEQYYRGEVINAFTVPEVEGKRFLGWDNPVPVTMGDSDLEFTAQYADHTHSYKEITQYGSCDEGITYVYACSCGDTYKTVSAACEHKLSASVTNCDGLNYAVVTCENCGYSMNKFITYKVHFSEEELGEENESGTGTNQILDLNLYNAENIAVQPDGSMEITIPATAQMLCDDNLVIYRINEDGSRDEIPFVKDADSQTLTMSVDHFSYYVITADEDFLKEMTFEKINCEFTAGHIDNDNDGICDYCKTEMENTFDCAHFCHSDKWYHRFVWFFIRFFSKIFGINQYCDCGCRHY